MKYKVTRIDAYWMETKIIFFKISLLLFFLIKYLFQNFIQFLRKFPLIFFFWNSFTISIKVNKLPRCLQSHMITRSDALNNQKRAKNSSKMTQFPCDMSSCNIPSVSHAIWVAATLWYMISRCISVWVPIVSYVPHFKVIFFCNIAYCMLHWCKIPLRLTSQHTM